jgi:hypothetical protein
MKTGNRSAESGKSFGVERKIAWLRLKNRLAQKKSPFKEEPFPSSVRYADTFG